MAALTFATDLDGVCYPLLPMLRHWLTTRHGIPANRLPDPDTYDFTAAWGFPDHSSMLNAIIDACNNGPLFRVGHADPHAHAALHAIRTAGHRIVAITARDLDGITPRIADITRRWMSAADLPCDQVIVTSAKQHIPFDLLLDDCPANVRTALDHGRAALLLDQPWNRDHPDLPRATWPQIPPLLDAMRDRASRAA